MAMPHPPRVLKANFSKSDGISGVHPGVVLPIDEVPA